jgi:uncharacterized protein with NRDE domain
MCIILYQVAGVENEKDQAGLAIMTIHERAGMCLIVVAQGVSVDFPLIVVANRDEFYDRPSAQAEFWKEAPHVLGGRDLLHGGTWMGISRTGHLAMLSNVRDPGFHRHFPKSRGELVSDFLVGDMEEAVYLNFLRECRGEYPPYNLIFGRPGRLFYYSNYSDRFSAIGSGTHGLSNHQLDTPWPKVTGTIAGIRAVIGSGSVSPDALFDVLADRRAAADDTLPDTGVGLDWERTLSARFIVSDGYGTRCSTVILLDREQQVSFVEKSFGPGGIELARRDFNFLLGE